MTLDVCVNLHTHDWVQAGSIAAPGAHYYICACGLRGVGYSPEDCERRLDALPDKGHLQREPLLAKDIQAAIEAMKANPDWREITDDDKLDDFFTPEESAQLLAIADALDPE